MLTKDLLRIRVSPQGEVQPGWLDPGSERDRERAQQLIDLFLTHQGASRGELAEALKLETGQGRDWRILRGLAKLLMDRTEIEVASELDPQRVREVVFEHAAPRHPVDPLARAEVLAQAAVVLDATPEEVESALFADLAASQRVVRCDAPDAEALLHRYNVALLQGVVMRSAAIELTLPEPSPKRLRQILRFLKFYRLMVAAERSEDGKGWRLRVDGPLSVVRQSSRYGVAMANFVPALLLAEDWKMEAGYQRTKGTRKGVLRLDSSFGLRSHYRDTGTWVAPEEKALVGRLRELAAPWTVDEGGSLVDLDGRDVLVPDLVLRNPETGEEALIEIAWRWRKGQLARRWKLLTQAGPENLVLAVCSAQGADGSGLPKLPGPIHAFKTTPNVRTLLKLARSVARVP